MQDETRIIYVLGFGYIRDFTVLENSIVWQPLRLLINGDTNMKMKRDFLKIGFLFTDGNTTRNPFTVSCFKSYGRERFTIIHETICRMNFNMIYHTVAMEYLYR